MKKYIGLLATFICVFISLSFNTKGYKREERIQNGYGTNETNNFYEIGHFVKGKLQGKGIKYNSLAVTNSYKSIPDHYEMGNYVNGELNGFALEVNEESKKNDRWYLCYYENGKKTGNIYSCDNYVKQYVENATEFLRFRYDAYVYNDSKYPSLKMIYSDANSEVAAVYEDENNKTFATNEDLAFAKKVFENLFAENIITSPTKNRNFPSYTTLEEYKNLCKKIDEQLNRHKTKYNSAIGYLNNARLLFKNNQNQLLAKQEKLIAERSYVKNSNAKKQNSCVACNGTGKSKNQPGKECLWCNGSGIKNNNIDLLAKTEEKKEEKTYTTNTTNSITNKSNTNKTYTKICSVCKGNTGEWVRQNWKEGVCSTCTGNGRIQLESKLVSNGYTGVDRKETFHYETTYKKCTTCNGTGNKFKWVDCKNCSGTGVE
jgi:hypothetical protein